MLLLQRSESGISKRRFERRRQQHEENLRKESCVHAHFSNKDIVYLEPQKTNLLPLHPSLPKAGQKLSIDGALHRFQQRWGRDFVITDYIVCQPVLCETTRSKLVDWLIHLGGSVDCTIDKLFLTMNFFDRFAMERAVTNVKLIAFASLLLAVKAENVSPKVVTDRLCHNAGYTNHEAHTMMNTISTVVPALNESGVFDQPVTSASFLRLYLKVSHSDDVIRYLACYLAECLLAEYDAVINFYPSELAAAALLVARRTLANKYIGPAWSATLTKFSGHSENKLDKFCIPFLESIMEHPAAPSVVRKYAGIQHNFVSKIKVVFH